MDDLSFDDLIPSKPQSAPQAAPQAAPVAQQAPPSHDDLSFDDLVPSGGTRAKAENAELNGGAPIIITGVRPGVLKPQETNSTYTVQGFDVAPDYVPHTALSDDDKREYAGFFKDPKRPPSAALLQLWYKHKTGADLGDAQAIVDHFRRTGQFSTQERIDLPKPPTGKAQAFFDHTANALVGDYGAEVAGALDTVVGNGSWANNADLEHAQLAADSQDHPIMSGAGELAGAALTIPVGNVASDAVGLTKLGELPAAIIRGTGEGAIYGSGAAGPGHRISGAAGGASLGALTSGAITGAGLGTARVANVEAADAADRLNADLGTNIQPTLANSAQGRLTRGIRAGSDATLIGTYKLGKDGQSFVDQTGAAKDALVQRLAPDVTDPSLEGAAAKAVSADENADTLNNFHQREQQRTDALYKGASTLAGGQSVNSPKTVAFLDSEIARMKAAAEPTGELMGLRKFFAKAQPVSALRDKRSIALGGSFNRQSTISNGALKTAWKLSGEDIQDGLTAAGKQDAADAFTNADKEYSNSLANRSFVKSLLSKGGDPNDLAARIQNMSRNDVVALRRLVQVAPEQAPEVRAGIVKNLGVAREGKPNAGEWSPDQFATDWNKLPEGAKSMFPDETRRALDDLSTLAQGNKVATSLTNRSRTSHAINVLHHIQQASKWISAIGNPTIALAGHLPAVAGEAAVSYSLAKVLTSPRFARTLVNIQKTGQLGRNLRALRVLSSRMSAQGGKPLADAIIASLSGAEPTPNAKPHTPQTDLPPMPEDDNTTAPEAPDDTAQLQAMQDQLEALQAQQPAYTGETDNPYQPQ